MMHALIRAMFPDNRRRLLTHRREAGESQHFRVLVLVLAVSLGHSSALHAATATWNANPEANIAGYILSYGTQPGVHPTSVDVGNVTTHQVTTLTPGQSYYFVLQAYDTAGLIG